MTDKTGKNLGSKRLAETATGENFPAELTAAVCVSARTRR